MNNWYTVLTFRLRQTPLYNFKDFASRSLIEASKLRFCTYILGFHKNNGYVNLSNSKNASHCFVEVINWWAHSILFSKYFKIFTKFLCTFCHKLILATAFQTIFLISWNRKLVSSFYTILNISQLLALVQFRSNVLQEFLPFKVFQLAIPPHCTNEWSDDNLIPVVAQQMRQSINNRWHLEGRRRSFLSRTYSPPARKKPVSQEGIQLTDRSTNRSCHHRQRRHQQTRQNQLPIINWFALELVGLEVNLGAFLFAWTDKRFTAWFDCGWPWGTTATAPAKNSSSRPTRDELLVGYCSAAIAQGAISLTKTLGEGYNFDR